MGGWNLTRIPNFTSLKEIFGIRDSVAVNFFLEDYNDSFLGLLNRGSEVAGGGGDGLCQLSYLPASAEIHRPAVPVKLPPTPPLTLSTLLP